MSNFTEYFYNIKIVTIERRIQMLKSLFSVLICKMTNTIMFHRLSNWIFYSNRMHAKLLKRNKPHDCIYIPPFFMSSGKALMYLQVLLIWVVALL